MNTVEISDPKLSGNNTVENKGDSTNLMARQRRAAVTNY